MSNLIDIELLREIRRLRLQLELADECGDTITACDITARIRELRKYIDVEWVLSMLDKLAS